MNQEDGNIIRNILEDLINTELTAGNRVTKCNGNFIAQTLMAAIHKIVANDTNKELLWKEQGEKWLAQKEKEKENQKEKENKDTLNRSDNVIELENEAQKLEQQLKKGKK